MPDKSPVILRITPGNKAYVLFKMTITVYSILSKSELFLLLDSELNSKIFDHLNHLFSTTDKVNHSRISLTTMHLSLLLCMINEIVEKLNDISEEQLNELFGIHVSNFPNDWLQTYKEQAGLTLLSLKNKLSNFEELQPLIQKVITSS